MITIDVRMLGCSGIGTYIRNIVPRVIAARPDTTVTLLGNPYELAGYGWAHGDNVRIVACRSPIYSLAEQVVMARLIPSHTDLFWSPHYNIPLCYRGKLLVTVHDLFHRARPEFVRGLHRRLYARYMFSAVARRADAIVAVSRFTADELARFTTVDRKKVHVIELGVAPFWFERTGAPPPRRRPYILYVGNVKPHKNLSRLVEAYAMVASRSDVDLVIVGRKDGFITGDTAVEKRAERLGERVVFTGEMDIAQLRGYYAHAETLVLPSLYESFGLPPLEAMASGCPVVVSDIAPLRDVCGDAALFCDPMSPADITEKIHRLMHDEALKKTLRAKGLERARSFTWEMCAAKTCAVIERTMQ